MPSALWRQLCGSCSREERTALHPAPASSPSSLLPWRVLPSMCVHLLGQLCYLLSPRLHIYPALGRGTSTPHPLVAGVRAQRVTLDASLSPAPYASLQISLPQSVFNGVPSPSPRLLSPLRRGSLLPNHRSFLLASTLSSLKCHFFGFYYTKTMK